jgi:indole-3-glycerol phosphate synthase
MNFETMIAAKQQHLQQRKSKTPIDAVRALASMQNRPTPLLTVINDTVQVIGQISHALKASNLRDTYDPVSTALRFSRAGVHAVSLFADGMVYERGMDDLTLVARALKLPVITQDYILDEYHIVEVRAAGASALTLSCDVLDRHALRTLVGVTQRNLMTEIVQVHQADQLDYAIQLSPSVVALGAPDHQAFEMAQLAEMRARIPAPIRVMFSTCLTTLEQVQAALDLHPDALVIAPNLVANDNSISQLRQLFAKFQDTR